MKGRDWQGTAFILWVCAGLLALFLLRHPAGKEAAAGPWGGALAASVPVLLYAGWMMGWPGALRPVGAPAAVGILALCLLLRPSPGWGLGLEAALLPLFLWRPGWRLPAVRLPVISFPARVRLLGGRRTRAGGEEEAAGEEMGPALPPWVEEAGWEEIGEPQPVPSWETLPPDATFYGVPVEAALEALELPPEALEAPEETGEEAPAVSEAAFPELPEEAVEAAPEEAPARPAAPRRPDRAVLLAGAVRGLLHSAGVQCPFLHLEAGKGGTALEFLLSSRREGERISSLRRRFEEALGAAPGEALQGQVLRLSFPAHARAENADGAAGDSLWVPLGNTERGRFLVNMAAVGPLLLVGESGEALFAAAHAVIGTVLSSAEPVEVLLAGESRIHLEMYEGLVCIYDGAECISGIKALAYERSHRKISSPPVLAVLFSPSPGLQEQIPPLLAAGPPAGVYPLIVLDTPHLWTTKTLGAMVRARLLFRTSAEESRFYLGRPGAEALGDYQALYHLAETETEPRRLRTYGPDEEALQNLLSDLGRRAA